ncbi:tRNA pseudouridine(38-40) synthase TruA [Nocardioides caldifontis]|uniref:tRNA pseudouridine(38-40) synthase TruA n=1 Tax=Nocardioides caldifontis TaxID=2588938 RepID=UPI001EF0A419|nr:tRNA pseudouridine(38-40) synthase TruA [Nocardioides caldifontis]
MSRTEPPCTRLRLDLSYDGTGFHGWAAQPGLRTVQGELERALATVLRVDAVPVTCAGRTDTGVHARGQVVHLDVDEERLVQGAGRSADPPEQVLLRRLNGVLDGDVRIRRATRAPEGFDARFSPLWRRYVYRVADRPEAVDPLVRGHVLTWSRPLDDAAMNDAASALLGEHDFAAYCRRREGATTVRTLLELRWDRSPEGVAQATVRADAFCHNMVRALVGSMLAVGEGRRTTGWPAEVLHAGVRDPAVLVVPPHGLTLEQVAYPPDDEVAARAGETRRTRTVAGGPSGG